MKPSLSFLAFLLSSTCQIAIAQAQDVPATVPAAAEANPLLSADIGWMLLSTALVMLMTPGLALFYGGMVKSKNQLSTLMHSFVAMALVSIVWFAGGYSLAFGKSVNGFFGELTWPFLIGVGSKPNADYAASIPHTLFMLFQCMFAIITPALISGAIAERMKFKAYLPFIALWSLLVYSPVAHWVWGVGGFMRTWGALDFAGGLVVHQTAGFSALAAALVLGKRSDFGQEHKPSNIPMVLIGTALLWFGWFGFNGGSALGATDLAVTGVATTHFAAAAAALAWLMMDWIVKGKPTVIGACVGAVVGLVAVTPASGFVTVPSAVIIGAVSAIISNLTCVIMRRSIPLDDTLDVFACHGMGGLVGALMTGLLASKAVNPAGVDGSFQQFMIQLKASAIVGLYSFVATVVILKAIQLVMAVRASAAEETEGLDSCEHGEEAMALAH